jgi:hypothetical protein
MNTLLNTLYTPLDCPDRPEYDVIKLKEWISDQHQKLREIRAHMHQGNNIGEHVVKNYPWAPVNPFNRTFGGWQGDFDTKFPALANYFSSAFDLTINDINNLLVLPVKEDHSGMFWHQDPDENGLRMYLDFEESDNGLALKKTKLPYEQQPEISARYFPAGGAPNIEDFLEDEIHTCRLLKPSQCFYLNNVRAAHSTVIHATGKSRIAVIIYHNKTKPVLDKIAKLVERSVTKYSDYAITF